MRAAAIGGRRRAQPVAKELMQVRGERGGGFRDYHRIFGISLREEVAFPIVITDQGLFVELMAPQRHLGVTYYEMLRMGFEWCLLLARLIGCCENHG